MKKLFSGIMAIAISVMSFVAAEPPVSAAVLNSFEFDNETDKSGAAYFGWYFGSAADWSTVQYSQAEFAGEKVLAGNVGTNKELKTYQKLLDRDKVFVESEIGFPATDADRAYMVGIGPVTNDADGKSNYWDAVKIQQNNYVFLGGENLPAASKYQSGTLLKVGYAYDKKANTVTYYAITNNKEKVNTKTVTLSKADHTAVKLVGAALYLRGNATYQGTGYWNYLHVDTAENMAVTSVTPEAGSECVAASKTIKISFNNVIDPNNMGTVTLKSADGTAVATTSKIYDGRTLVITPAASLAENTAYTLSVTGTKDLLGSSANASTEFTTGDKYHVHYEFDDVTAKSGHYFSQGTGTPTAMKWEQGEADGKKVLKGTVADSNEALSFENLPEMDNVICEMSAMLPSSSPADEVGLRPVGYNLKWTSGIRITKSQYFLLNGALSDKSAGFYASPGKFYRIGFGYNKAEKKVTYYVIGNNGTTSTKEVALAGDYLQGAGVFLNGANTSEQIGYYDYLYIDKVTELTAKNVNVSNNGMKIEYSNVLNPNGISAVYEDLAGNKIAGTVAVSDGNILSVTAPSTLKSGITYSLTVSGVKDVSGLEAANVVRDIKVSAIKGLVEDFEGFAGQSFTGGSNNTQVGNTLFVTEGKTTGIEMVTLDEAHGVSAKMNVDATLGNNSQIWIVSPLNNAKKAVIGYSAYMPAPGSQTTLNCWIKSSGGDDDLVGINSLQNGRVLFKGQPRSWYMEDTEPRWHDIRLYIDYENKECHMTVDGGYVRSEKINITSNAVASVRFCGANAAGTAVYLDDFVCYEVSDFDPVFSVKNGVATVEFGQETANVSVSTTENVTTVSERGTNPVAASFDLAEGAVLSVRTLDGIYHRYTYSDDMFAPSAIAAVDYYDSLCRYSSASGLTNELNVKIKVMNPGAGEASKTTCVALYDYDTGELVAFGKQAVSFTAGETEKTVVIPFTGLGLEGLIEEGSKRVSAVKTFLFDGLNSIGPVDNAIVWEW